MHKNTLIALVVIVVSLFGAASLLIPKKNSDIPSEKNISDEYTVDSSDLLKKEVPEVETPPSLSDEERASLIFMREEEKLARDVYQSLGNTWNKQIFFNIAQSEETHMNAVLGLLEKYNIPDPVVSDAPGSFSNPMFQKLYQELAAKGMLSQEKAFEVGATIEDLDISDLNKALTQTSNPAIEQVFQNLMKGSRNHLRAFNRQLEQVSGAPYQAQYISASELQTILNTPQEKGPIR